jgi:cytidyltransferase-like protein
MPEVVVYGAFDDPRSRHVRFLQEAALLGSLTVLLWSDETCCLLNGSPPAFGEQERQYFLSALRFVERVNLAQGPVEPDRLPSLDGLRPDLWAVDEAEDTSAKGRFSRAEGIGYHVVPAARLSGFPLPALPEPPPNRKKVIVTGCYDWLHSGHIRFFEVVSGLADLYVSIGSDATIRALKGKGHPMLTQEERLYMVQAVRSVAQAFVASGGGYLDAAPEIEILRPDLYAVNEDGDRPEKRVFCQERGIEYVVLQRTPRQGLPSRQSTHLRGY